MEKSFRTKSFKKSNLENLRVFIKGRELESKTVYEHKIRKSFGQEKHVIQLKQNSFGSETRLYLLAYAFLRGVPYAVVEASTNEPIRESYKQDKIAKICHFFVDNQWMIGKTSGKELNSDHIKDWLLGKNEYFIPKEPPKQLEAA